MVGFHRDARTIGAAVTAVHGTFPLLISGVVPLTEKFLASIAGWPVIFEARKIRAAGKVKAARYEPPLLKGAVRAGSRLYASGLRLVSPTNVENICSCRLSQLEGDGMICPHSVAVALEVIHGEEKPHPPSQP